MKAEHKYAQVLRWIADGEDVQGRWHRSDEWVPVREWGAQSRGEILQGEGGWIFRLKPRVITVNGREVQAGEEKPPIGEFFFVDIASSDCFGSTVWGGTRLDRLRLERGLVHLTKEAAIAHARAMLNIPESAENEIYE